MVWVQFKEDLVLDTLNLEDIAAMNLAEQFKEIDLGDYDVEKDTPSSIVINFRKVNTKVIESGEIPGVIEYLSKQEMMDKFKINKVASYDQAPKFVAHNFID